MSALRDLISFALLLAALVLGTLWLPAVWIEDNVVDQDGFLAVAEPLADDAALQRTLSDSAVDELLDSDVVPGWITEQLTPIAQEQAAKAADTEAYATTWRTTMASLHTALFTAGDSPLDVDLAPTIDVILTGAEDYLPIDLPRPDSAVVTLATVPDVPLLRYATVLDPWAGRLGPIALGLAVAALLIARHRRTMLLLAGVAALAAGGLTYVMAANVETLIPDAADQASFIGPIIQVFEQQLAADVTAPAVILAGAGALAAAAGLVLMGLHRPDRRS
ncbi:hypothetical protein ACXET9_02105 [Brachybacterium sp. DNPG3]